MNRRSCIADGRALALASVLTLASALSGQAQQPAAPASPPIKLGIVSFLTGPAASPFGIPGRNGAEIVIEALNAGTLPPPYNTVGFGGTKIEAKYVDEAGSTANVVTEFRNLVQRDQVDAVVGYISSGSCLAVTPVAEELKALTVYFDCGTPRIFEEKPRKYVFRPSPHATMDNVGAAKYLVAKKTDVALYSGINQNYAWGQDSWRDFVGAMNVLSPKAKVEKELFPKLFAGEYGAEISTLLTSKSQALHTSFWDGDLESFVYQEQTRGLNKRMPIIYTTGESAIWRLRDKMPDGAIVAQPLVPEDLHRPLRHAADLSVVPDGARPPRPESGMGEGGAEEGRRQADDRRRGDGVRRHRVRRPERQGQTCHRQRPSGHSGNRLRHLPLQPAEGPARTG